MVHLAGGRLERLVYLCIALLLLQTPVIATTELYKEPGGLVKLFETVEGFRASVTESDEQIWLINFFADDCNNCLLLASKVPEIAKKLDGVVGVGAVNCTQVPVVCGVTGIQFLPSLKVFDWEVKENPYTNVPYKEPPKEVLREGEVDITALVKEVKGLVPDKLLRKVVSGSPEETTLFQETGSPKVLFLSTKKKPPVFLRSLSIRFRERLDFFVGSLDDEGLLKRLPEVHGNEDSLYVVKPGGEILLVDPSFRQQQIVEFLSARAIERPKKRPSEASERDDIMIEDTPSRTGHIFPLNSSAFETEVLKAEAAWVVAFFREPCQEKYEEWVDASVTLSGQVRIGDYNLSAHPEGEKLLADAALESLLTTTDCLRIVSYPFGENKEGSRAEVYDGPLDGKVLSKFGLASIPDFVQALESNEAVDDFLSHEQWKPKMLLFSAKKETPDMWRALAARFRRAIGFALIHEDDTEILERFEITKVPKVLTIFAKPDEGSDGLSLSVQRFPKALKHSHLTLWCHQISATLEQTVKKGQGGALSVREIATDNDFQQICVDRGICIVALLDGAKDTLSSHVDTLKQVAQINSLGPIAYAWVNIAAAPGFASQLGLSRSDAPTVVLLNVKKMRYARLEGGFSARALERFVDGVVSGKTAVSTLEALPTLAGGPAEAGDAPVEQVEEEFNLEDVMKEEVEASDVKSRQEKLAELERQTEEEAAALRLEKDKLETTATSGSSKKTKKNKKGNRLPERTEL